MIKQVVSFNQDEIKDILNDYLLDKGFKNITSIKITIGGNPHDFITGNGYVDTKLTVETTKDEII